MVCSYCERSLRFANFHFETEITISVVNGTQIISKFLKLLFETSNTGQLKN